MKLMTGEGKKEKELLRIPSQMPTVQEYRCFAWKVIIDRYI